HSIDAIGELYHRPRDTNAEVHKSAGGNLRRVASVRIEELPPSAARPWLLASLALRSMQNSCTNGNIVRIVLSEMQLLGLPASPEAALHFRHEAIEVERFEEQRFHARALGEVAQRPLGHGGDHDDAIQERRPVERNAAGHLEAADARQQQV